MSTDTTTADRLDLADRLAIADHFARYANLLDEKRWEDAHTVFTDDITVHSPRARIQGIDTVMGYMRQGEVDGEYTQHLTTDLLVTVDGDRAEATANSLVYFFRADSAPHQTSGLRMTCTLTRTSGGWRISATRVDLRWIRRD